MKKENYKIIDISPTLSETTPVFPGDVSFKQTTSMSTKSGDHISLSSMQTTLHIGSHADAPIHYDKDGCDIESRELHFYYGRVQVIDLSERKIPLISLSDIKNCNINAERVLFKTNSYDHEATWSDDFTAISSETIQHLSSHGVITVGIDTPSVDPASSKDLHAHQAICSLDMAILESLDLRHVEAGFYTLSALPLKIRAGDAAPVRAILIKDQ
jgi:arylformamidase